MRVFVTDGTGALGSCAVPALIAAGHEVTAMARSDAKADARRRQGATPVRVSLFDRNARLRDATNWRPQFPSVWDGYQAMAQR